MKPNFITMNRDFEKFKTGEIDSTKLRTPYGKPFAVLSLAEGMPDWPIGHADPAM